MLNRHQHVMIDFFINHLISFYLNEQCTDFVDFVLEKQRHKNLILNPHSHCALN